MKSCKNMFKSFNNWYSYKNIETASYTTKSFN